MQIQAKNLTEVIISLIALAGEIPKDIKIFGVTDAAINNQINRLKKQKMIKYDSNHNRVRIKSPDGLEYLKGFSSDLYEHYMMVSNNHQFQSGSRPSENNKLFSECVLFMLQCGYLIDNIQIKYRSNTFGKQTYETDDVESVLSGGLFDLGEDNFTKNGNIVSLEEAATLTSEKKFFTSKYLKRGFTTTDKLNISAISGMIVSEGNVYSVFYRREGTRINVHSERAMNVRIREIYKYAFDEEGFSEFAKEYPKAIIINANINSQPKKITTIGKLFKNSYQIPASVKGMQILDLITEKKWKAKLKEALYGDDVSPDNSCDGTYDGSVSWELLSCEYEKITTAEKYINQIKTAHFICFQWQEKFVKNMTRNINAKITVLSQEQENILFEIIAKGEE